MDNSIILDHTQLLKSNSALNERSREITCKVPLNKGSLENKCT